MSDHDGQNRSRKRHFGYEAGAALMVIVLVSLTAFTIRMLVA